MRLVGKKIPFVSKWEYTIYKDFDDPYPYDSFTSARKLTAEEMKSVEVGYSEALDGYRPPTVVSV